MARQVVFIANDFGFGPSSRAHAIARSFQQAFPDIKATYLTSGKNDYLFADSDVALTTCDDTRSSAALKQTFKQFDNALIVSVMNRFAITAARELGLPNILLDGLSWFWKSRPVEYDRADHQIRYTLPWKAVDGVSLASPIDIEQRIPPKQTVDALININGFITPFHKQSHDVYLAFIDQLAQNVAQTYPKVLVTGNQYAITKLQAQASDSYQLAALSKAAYLGHVEAARVVILNGGSNSFNEALALHTDILFSLPSNQSQYELIREVAQQTHSLVEELCPALSLIPNHSELSKHKTEDTAIDFLTSKLSTSLQSTDSMHSLIATSPLSTECANCASLYSSAERCLHATQQTIETIYTLVQENR